MGVDQEGHAEQSESEGPGSCLDHCVDRFLHGADVGAEVGVGQPCDTIDGNNRDHACLKDRALNDIGRFDPADEQDQAAN